MAVAKFRVDKNTQKGSVIDIIRMVTGYQSKDATNYFNRLSTNLSTRCRQLRINGKGRETWVADAPTLVEIIWELPGKAAKAFRRTCAQYICRILGGDLSLVTEIEARNVRTAPEVKQFMTAHTPVAVPAELTKEEKERLKVEWELEMQERRARLRRMQAETSKLEADAKKTEMDMSQSKRKDVEYWVNNDTLKRKHAQLYQVLVDNAVQTIIDTQPQLLTHHVHARDISTLMKNRLHTTLTSSGLQSAGRYLAKHYRKNFKEEPETKDKLVGGEIRQVKAYPFAREDWVVNMLTQWHKCSEQKLHFFTSQ